VQPHVSEGPSPLEGMAHHPPHVAPMLTGNHFTPLLTGIPRHFTHLLTVNGGVEWRPCSRVLPRETERTRHREREREGEPERERLKGTTHLPSYVSPMLTGTAERERERRGRERERERERERQREREREREMSRESHRETPTHTDHTRPLS